MKQSGLSEMRGFWGRGNTAIGEVRKQMERVQKRMEGLSNQRGNSFKEKAERRGYQPVQTRQP